MRKVLGYIITGGEVGRQYNPLFIADDAKNYYSSFHNVPEGYRPLEDYKGYFFTIIDWYLREMVDSQLGLLIPYKFNNRGVTAPWYSAITQARIAEIFVFAYRWTLDSKYLDIARRLVKPLYVGIKYGGFLYEENDVIFFEEYKTNDHVLNAHISVVLNLIEVNKDLKDERLSALIERAIFSTKKILPLYEIPEKMNFALRMEPGSVFSNPVLVENVHESYDFIHLKYLQRMYQITDDSFFKKIFARYYSVLAYRALYKGESNLASESSGSKIVETTGYDSNYSLEKAIENHGYNPKVYAVFNSRSSCEFSVVFDGERDIEGMKLRFHWDQYPRSFKLDALVNGIWQPLVNEDGWAPSNASPDYEASFSISDVSKIRFTASDWSGQKKLILDYFSIVERSGNERDVQFWKARSQLSVVKYSGIDFEDDDSDFSSINRQLIDGFSKKWLSSGESMESVVLRFHRTMGSGNEVFP
ncbi:D-glucuronyl C5-epimerase family protein [Endozoicomonas numazuensis]|uniref:D-glucuronyl C5-epimerase C-terminal domain-containing protein n=1 Tax=Endozoicomonas numazuensis TaxID=1137799 RepID=A0A081N3R2_9GAMM|nr:D-glucuronyl C5-epimerase family protein [Endozoicomonas numazuensis]KEQ13085.1 hypothetical protein GZ78_26375 [Endozoicomonas numazuensis]